MNEKINKFYHRFAEKNFYYLSAILSFVGDLSICLFLWLQFNDFDLFNGLFQKVLFSRGIDIQNVPASFIYEQYILMTSALKLMLSLLIIVHFIVYILFAFRKKSAVGYVRIMSALGVPTTFLFLFSSMPKWPLFSLFFFIQTFFYLFVVLGISYFKKQAAKTEGLENLS